jgi:hypothetical protein
MFDDRKQNRGLASLVLAGLVGVFVVGCTAAAPAGGAQLVSHPSAREDRLSGDPYQAGSRAPGTSTGAKAISVDPPKDQKARKVALDGRTGTHPGGGGPQK